MKRKTKSEHHEHNNNQTKKARGDVLLVSQRREKNLFHVETVFFELEGGSIFTLKNLFLDDKGISLKRIIKEKTGIPIYKQMIFAGKYQIKDRTGLLMYPIANETILKVYEKN